MLLTVLLAVELSAAGDTLSINIFIQDVVSVDQQFLPTAFALHPPYPNPFNPDVNLVVDIPREAATRVSIYNLQGREVVVLQDGVLSAGQYHYLWQAADYPAGLYFVRILSDTYEKSEKISLLK